MKTTLAFALVLAVTAAYAQNDKDGLSKPKIPTTQSVNTQAPVTQGEARAVFNRTAKVLSSVTKKKLPNSSLANGAVPVTRDAVVAEMARIFSATKPAFKYTPRLQKFDKGRLTLKDPAQRRNLETLIAFNMVAPFGPVASSDKNTLSVKEFGDAVGYFIARLADLTHLPSSKWTPALQPQ